MRGIETTWIFVRAVSYPVVMNNRTLKSAPVTNKFVGVADSSDIHDLDARFSPVGFQMYAHTTTDGSVL